MRKDNSLQNWTKTEQKLKCEFQFFISLLKKENEFYNTIKIDVSYKLKKMEVLQPKFSIPNITLLRNAAINSMQYDIIL